jgi:hypothetical protein
MGSSIATLAVTAKNALKPDSQAGTIGGIDSHFTERFFSGTCLSGRRFGGKTSAFQILKPPQNSGDSHYL